MALMLQKARPSKWSETISSNVNNQVFTTRLYALTGLTTVTDFIEPVYYFYDVESAVVVGSTTTTSSAVSVGTGWPTNSLIYINNQGSIIGKGGDGGAGGIITCAPSCNLPGFGGHGGDAIDAGFNITVNNTGTIAGGGGGGGGGGGAAIGDASDYGSSGSGGGGGAGSTTGAGNIAGTVTSCVTVRVGGAGDSGTQLTGGIGGFARATGFPQAAGGTPGVAGANGQAGDIPSAAGGGGGGGGGAGAAGGTGGSGFLDSGGTTCLRVGSIGGNGGKAVELNGNGITWVASGTLYGAVS